MLIGITGVFSFPTSRRYVLQPLLPEAPPKPPADSRGADQEDSPAPQPIHADVVIAEFDAHNANQRVEVARRLQSDLKAKLQYYGLDEVAVSILPNPILTDEEALIKAEGSKVFIWGWYDNFGVSVHLLTADEGNLSDFGEYPWSLGINSQQVSFTLRDTLPENVSFISLFAIGNLYYSSNNYAKGRMAFDAAMHSAPKSLGGKNQATLYFFRARQESGLNDEDAVCDYARALKLDPNMAMAYNNLSVLWERNYRFHPLERKKQCVQDALDFANNGFERAFSLKPKVALFQFNLLSEAWLARTDDAEAEGEVEIGTGDRLLEKRLLEIIKLDNSIPGAYSLLGVLAFDRDDAKKATRYFGEAVRLSPNSPEFRFNLAQALILGDDIAQAKTELKRATDAAPRSGEAFLELANLSLMENKPREASRYLASAARGESELDSFTDMVTILNSQVNFQQHHHELAAQKLGTLVSDYESNYTDNIFLHYAMGLLYLLADKQKEAALEAQKAADSCCPPVYADELKEFFGLKPSQNLELENTPRNRAENLLQVFYTVFQDEIKECIFHRWRYEQGHCPYVFTFDRQQNTWKFDTTVLYDLRGAQRTAIQTRRLTRFDGRLLIREVEPETSYIASIYILATDSTGRQFKLYPRPEIGTADLVLHQGDEVLLSFGDLPFQGKPASIDVVARGYYVPNRRAGAARGHDVR